MTGQHDALLMQDPTEQLPAPVLVVPLDDGYESALHDSLGQTVGRLTVGEAAAIYPGVVVGDDGGWTAAPGYARWQYLQLAATNRTTYLECNWEPRPEVMPHPVGCGALIDDARMQLSGAQTWCCWLRWAYATTDFAWGGDPGDGVLLALGAPGDRCLELARRGNALRLSLRTDAGTLVVEAPGSTSFDPGEARGSVQWLSRLWHHVAVVLEPGRMALYWNETLVAETTAGWTSVSLPASDAGVRLAAEAEDVADVQTRDSTRVSLSELRVYDRALSPEVISALATDRRPGSSQSPFLARISDASALMRYQGDVYVSGDRLADNPVPEWVGAWYHLDGNFGDGHDNFSPLIDISQDEGEYPEEHFLAFLRTDAVRYCALDGRQGLRTALPTDINPVTEEPYAGPFTLGGLIGSTALSDFIIAAQAYFTALPTARTWLWYGAVDGDYLGVCVDPDGSVHYIRAAGGTVVDTEATVSCQPGQWLRTGVRHDQDTLANQALYVDDAPPVAVATAVDPGATAGAVAIHEQPIYFGGGGGSWQPLGLRRIWLCPNTAELLTELERAMGLPGTRVLITPAGGGATIDATRHVQWLYDDHIRMQIPWLDPGPYQLRVRRARDLQETASMPFTVVDHAVHPGRWRQARSWDFRVITAGELWADFQAMHRQWGGRHGIDNGGQVRANIGMDARGLLLETHGDNYTGAAEGADKWGRVWPIRIRKGAGIVSRKTFGPGVFKLRAKMPPAQGVTYPFWTFHYEEQYPEDHRWSTDPSWTALTTQGNRFDGYYRVRNHEIDFPEVPSALIDDPDPEYARMDLIKFNAWIGEQPGEYSVNFFPAGFHIADDQVHEWEMRWYTHTTPRRCELWLDGTWLRTITGDTVPWIAQKMTLGVWVPSAPGNRWAGPRCGYDRLQVIVESFSYEPYDQAGCIEMEETYPGTGYAPPVSTVLPPIPFDPMQIYCLCGDFRADLLENLPGTTEDGDGNATEAPAIYDLAAGHHLQPLVVSAAQRLAAQPAFGGHDVIKQWVGLATPAAYSPFTSIGPSLELWVVGRFRSLTGEDAFFVRGSGCPSLGRLAAGNLVWGFDGTEHSLAAIQDTDVHVLRLVVDAQASGLWLDGTQVASGTLPAAALTRWQCPAADVEWTRVLAYSRRLTAPESADLLAWLQAAYVP